MTLLPYAPQYRFKTESSKWEKFAIEDFSGGLATAFPESKLRDNQFPALMNLYHQKSLGLKVRGPFRPIDVASAKESIIPNSAAPLTFKWIELSGTNYLLACWDNGSNYEVSYWDSSNNRWAGEGGGTTINAGLTDGYKAKFVKFSVNDAEDVIYCNGKDVPERWLGAAGAGTDLGLAVPSFDGAEAGAEDNTLDADDRGLTYAGVYTYKFTYTYDDSGTSTKYGESGPSAVITSADLTNASSSNPVACDLDLDLTDSALPTGVSRCNVYRSPPDRAEGPFEYVGYFTSGDTYKDNCPNGEEGDEITADAGTPPRLKNPIVFRGRLWGIGLNSSGALTNKGVWSEIDTPDMFLATNYAYFPEPLAGPALFNEDLYWFTEKAIYKTPNGDIATYPYPLKVADVGCDSWDSIVDVGSGLVWQYNGNVYWANFSIYNDKTGDFPFPIGEPIADKLEGIISGYEGNSVGVLHKDKYYLSYTAAGTTNSNTLVWDVTLGSQYLFKGLFGAWSEVDWNANALQSFGTTLYSADQTNKYIMEHEFSGVDDYHSKTEYDAGTSHEIPIRIETKLLHLHDEWAEKVIRSLSIIAETSGISIAATLQLNDNDHRVQKTLTLGSGSYTTGSSTLIWGVGTWGTNYWGTTAFGFQSSHAKLPVGSKGRNAKLVLTCDDAQDAKIVAVTLNWRPLPPPT